MPACHPPLSMFVRSARHLSCSRPPIFTLPRASIAPLRAPDFRFFTTSLRMSSPAFDRLIRFQTSDGNVKYGNLEKETSTKEIEGSGVEVLEGDVKSGFKKTGGKATVGKLLSPLKREELNIILCVGLNYRKHAEECNVRFSYPNNLLPSPPNEP
jgi:hypothetical protein